MSDLQFDLDNKNPSAKPSGIGATIFLFLFSLPFAGAGLFALVQGIRKLIAGNTHDCLPLCLIGLLFSGVGFGLMFVAIYTRKSAKKKAELEARFADKPWMLRADWAEGKIKSSASAQLIFYFIFAAAFCSLGGLGTALAVPDALHRHEYGGLMVLFFPAIGIVFLILLINTWRSQRRFGKCFFELAQTPIPLGGTLDGMILTSKPLKLEHELNLKFSCIRRVTTGSGKSRSTSEYALWESEKNYTAQAGLLEPEPGQTGIPVHFKLPDGQPQCFTLDNVSVFWRLEAKSKMRGPHFRVVFDLPVFKTADAPVADNAADEADPTASLLAPIEEIRREENSKIKISDGPNGREFYFPAARNIGSAMFVTVMTFVFIGIAVGTYHLHIMIVFPIVFGIVGVLMIFGTLSAWLKSSCVTIDPTTVRVTNRWLVFSRTRQFFANDFSRFMTKTGMQSGTQTFTDIKLIRRGSEENFAANSEKLQQTFQDTFQDASIPEAEKVMERFREAAGPSGVTVAGNIGSVAEANWLVEEMNKALGQSK